MSRRKAVPKALEKELYQEAGSKCCLCREADVTKLTVHHIVPFAWNPKHEASHMLVLCANCHSLATAGKIDREELYQAKLRTQQSHSSEHEPGHTATVSVVGNGNIAAGRDVNISPRVIKRTEVTPGPQHITEEQAFRIQEAIKELARVDELTGRGPTYREWYSKLYKRFHVTSYKLIAAERWEEAMAWLQNQKALQRPQLRRTNNPEWRKSMYSAIWARAKKIGISKEEVHEVANSRLRLKNPISSLTELGERNLSKLRGIIFRM